MRKNIMLVIAIIVTMFTATPTFANLRAYEDIAREFDNEVAPPEKVFATDDLTAEILHNRVGCGYVVVEKVIGICTNGKGDGKILNTKKSSYINYHRTHDFCTGKRIHKGDVVLTYLIYNPNNNYIDDVIERFDYIINQ